MPHNSVSEFYQYINKDGIKCYTDDPSLIAEIEDGKITTHKDKYDGLDEQEKKKLKEQETQEILKLKQKTQEAIEDYRKNERIKDAKEAKEIRLKNRSTPIKFSRNRILASVTIGYSGREVTVDLILDTGASITVLYNSVAEQLEINTGKQSAARVAGGGIVKTKIVEIEYLKVGPKTYKTPTIMVLNNKGPPRDFHGLLGQDFLSHFEYTIDYSKNLIIWR
ncbi:MAG: aspartyl protease family protein [Desulfobacterales bacterium]|nr:aspartyl protease family protein [Desulfobacterales bacterium]